MDYATLTTERALEELTTSSRGLGAGEAKRRLQVYGPNELTESGRTPLWRRLIEPFQSLFVLVLLGAAVISFISGERLDAAVMCVILVVNAFIYYGQQLSAGRVLKSLKAHDQHTVRVLRDGQPVSVTASHLVPGDIILLGEGDKIPADGRLLGATSFAVNESILTGESLAQNKRAEALAKPAPLYTQVSMVFAGTVVQTGTAEIVVTATGNETELGHITRLSEAKPEPSPLQEQIDRLTTRVMIVIAIVLAVTFGLALYRGMAANEALRFLLSLAVAAIPEGLPVALTLVLLFSVQRMARRHVLVRRLSAIETLGQVELIATDKTGTITKNQLEIAEYLPYGDDLEVFQDTLRHALALRHGHSNDPLELVIRNALTEPDGQPERILDFDQTARMSGALWHTKASRTLYLKGAPEHVIKACDLTPPERRRIEAQLEELASQGYRIIAFATRRTPATNPKLSELRGATFAGLIALADGIRPSVPAAIRAAHRAGIRVIMLTGDNAATATTIGRQAGIIEEHDHAATGSHLDGLNAHQIRTITNKTTIFARVLPEHKYAIINAWHGRLVTAMTGDGVNDVPALVRADVGVAVGRGSDAAKEAADIILLRDNFATLIEAVAAGRAILANVRKMLMYLFATTIGEVGTMVLALVIGLPLPVTPLQILWVNMVTDGFTVIPLGLEPTEAGQMKRAPEPRRTAILSRRQVVRVALAAITIAVLVLAVFAFYRARRPELAGTMAFTALVVIQWANALTMRSEHHSFFSSWRRPNWWLWGSLTVAAVLQFALLFSPLQGLFDAHAIGAGEYGVLALVFALALLLGDLARILTVHTSLFPKLQEPIILERNH